MLTANPFHFGSFTDDRPYREADTLSKAGYEVHVICTRPRGAPKEENLHGIYIHRVAIPYTRGVGYVTLVPLLLAMRSVNLGGIVHVRNCPDTLSLGKLWRPLILDINDPWSLDAQMRGVAGAKLAIVRGLEKLALSLADYLLCVSHAEKERLLREGMPDCKVSVIYNCPALTEFEQPNSIADVRKSFGIRSSSRIILFEGRLGKDRGLDVLLRAFTYIHHEVPDTKLLIVGDGPERGTLEQLAHDLSIASDVVFTGWRSLSELPSFIRGSNVCVIPSKSTPKTEITPHNKLFDYMALGKPIVASRLGEISRVVQDGTSAILVRPGDDLELSKALLAVLQDENLSRNLGLSAYELFRGKFNWDEQSKILLSVYSRFA